MLVARAELTPGGHVHFKVGPGRGSALVKDGHCRSKRDKAQTRRKPCIVRTSLA